MHHHIYDKLHAHLHRHPIGFPKSASGKDMEILKKLFTKEEAELALHLVPWMETAEQLSTKSGIAKDELEKILATMADKGLILKYKRKGEPRYALVPFLPGIWELQMPTMDEEFARAFEDIYPDLAKDLFGSETAWIRVLASEKSITNLEVVPYQKASEVVKNVETIAIADCVCRRERKLVGHNCSSPSDSICLYFTPWAEVGIEKGWAQKATVEDALKVIKRGQDAGLVHQGVNVLDRPTGLCQCCPCCCVVLRAATELKLPHVTAKSDFYSTVDIELCNGCESCTTVCPISAISMEDGKAVVNRDECLGCGICVLECPTEALSMTAKKQEEVHMPPRNFLEMLRAIATEKGRTYFFK